MEFREKIKIIYSPHRELEKNNNKKKIIKLFSDRGHAWN